MTVEGMGALIAQLGFPAFVAVFVLMRLEPVIRDLQRTVTVLTVVVAQTSGVDYAKACEMAGKHPDSTWRIK